MKPCSKRPHERESLPKRGDTPGEARSAGDPIARPSRLGEKRQEPSRLSGHLVSGAKEGHLRSWLLLACSSRLPWHAHPGERGDEGVLARKASSKRDSRQGVRARANRAWVGDPDRVGMRDVRFRRAKTGDREVLEGRSSKGRKSATSAPASREKGDVEETKGSKGRVTRE